MATNRNILDIISPLSRPAFSAIRGYGSLTCGLRNSSCFSAKSSQQIPRRDPMYAEFSENTTMSASPGKPKQLILCQLNSNYLIKHYKYKVNFL